MTSFRKILLILAGIIIISRLLMPFPKTVSAQTCATQWACSPSCILAGCYWQNYGCYNYSPGPGGPYPCGTPGLYPNGIYYDCGAAWVPYVNADCDTLYHDRISCEEGNASGGYRGCTILATATPPPGGGPTNTPPPGATNTPVPPTNTPPPGVTFTPTPTSLPCPSNFSVSCAGSGLQVTINWDDLAGAVGYVLRVNKEPYEDWAGPGDLWYEPVSSIQTFDIVSSTNYKYDVQGKKPGEVYPYLGARCPFAIFNCPAPTATPTPIPIPPQPVGSCGTYNAGYTPVTWNWTPVQASGIQVWDNTGQWYFNNWWTPPRTDSIITGRTVSARTTYDFTTFSTTASITCPTPTATPTPTYTPTPTPLPTIPMPTGVCSNYVPSDHTFSVTWNWQAMFGAINYWLQSFNNNVPVQWFVNDWIGNITSYVITGVPADFTNSARVRWTNDPAYINLSPWSSYGTVTCALPTLYPTVAISGNLREYLGNTCPNDISTNTVSVDVNPQNPAGITVDCGITPPTGQIRSSYRCTVAFDNQNFAPTPAQNINLSASAAGYSSAYWTNANACTDVSNNSLPVDVSSGGSTVYDKDIFFEMISPWIKIKNSSFSSPASLANAIPLNISAYDADDDAAQRYFILNSINNDPGLVTAQSINVGTADVSSTNWRAVTYLRNTALTPSSFTQYVTSRKEHTVISSLSSINKDGIYVWQTGTPFPDITAVPSQFNSYNVLLIVPGAVTIDMANFNPSRSIAIMATTINFSATVTNAAGIFIAQTISTGTTANQGLKIVGNLIALSTLNNDRVWADNSKPSLFIVFDANKYLDLFPYLSTVSYQWNQIQ